jgi:hypothetical protein
MRLPPKKLALASAGVSLALAFATTSAGAANHARTPTGCSNETVRVFGTPTTLRFALHGVSCRQAHSLIRRYFRTATPQRCRTAGNVCILDFAGGWTCSYLIATEGPGFVGCFKTASERFKVFRVTRRARDARAASAQRYPVMGCNADGFAPTSPYEAYAPANCLVALGAGLETWAAVHHVRWSHWGARSATGKGFLRSYGCAGGCGPAQPASMAIYGLVTDRSVNGRAYTWLRVTLQGQGSGKRTWTYYVRPKRPSRASAAAQTTWINASGCAGPGFGLVWAQHPAKIGVTCDPHDQIVDARWRNWGQAESQATAVLAVDNCEPSCGAGRVRRYAITLVTSKIRHCGTRRVYASVIFYERVAGRRRAYPIVAEGFC